MTGPPPGYTLADESSIFRARGFNTVVGQFYYRTTPEAFSLVIHMRPEHLNMHGAAHGGLIATIADLALGAAIFAHTPNLATISLHVDYIDRAVEGDWLECTGILTRARKTIAFARGQINVGDRPIAQATGVFRIFPAPRS